MGEVVRELVHEMADLVNEALSGLWKPKTFIVYSEPNVHMKMEYGSDPSEMITLNAALAVVGGATLRPVRLAGPAPIICPADTSLGNHESILLGSFMNGSAGGS